MQEDYSNIRSDGSLVYLRTNTGEWFYYDRRDPLLGRGAMGTVYVGREYGNHRRLVAIKRLSDSLADNPNARRRAREEAALAFRHRNLVEMIGYCEEDPDSGPLFIVSNLVQGMTIDKYVSLNLGDVHDRPERIVRCCLPVLDALDYLHSKNILHMDIKPSNIMVENGNNIRLMDLGIACSSSVISSSNGGLLGTPGFAAPEQYVDAGQTELNISRATDIYELGATIYNLISGEKPYDDGSTRLAAIPGVKGPLMDVISTSLEKRQENRYQSAREFKAALMDAMQSKPKRNTNNWILPVLAGIAAAIVLLFIITKLN